MPEKGGNKFKLLAGPLDTGRSAKGSLGGEDVNLPGPKSCPDPLGLNHAGGDKTAKKSYKKE